MSNDNALGSPGSDKEWKDFHMTAENVALKRRIEELEVENACYAEMLDESKLVRQNERHKDKRRRQRIQIEALKAKLDIAHNWVLNNADHSESYNQFVKALQQEGE
jgi:hypothetical protein